VCTHDSIRLSDEYTLISKEKNKMTNAEIIMNEQIKLMEDGIIKGTGRMMEAVITDADGNETKQMIEEPEAIHTYATWKELGYQVKKGQKAKATFTIWKYVKGKKKDENEEEPEAKMFMTTAHFFTFDQVEKIA
jgi:hypothetical protein